MESNLELKDAGLRMIEAGEEEPACKEVLLGGNAQRTAEKYGIRDPRSITELERVSFCSEGPATKDYKNGKLLSAILRDRGIASLEGIAALEQAMFDWAVHCGCEQKNIAQRTGIDPQRVAELKWPELKAICAGPQIPRELAPDAPESFKVEHAKVQQGTPAYDAVFAGANARKVAEEHGILDARNILDLERGSFAPGGAAVKDYERGTLLPAILQNRGIHSREAVEALERQVLQWAVGKGLGLRAMKEQCGLDPKRVVEVASEIWPHDRPYYRRLLADHMKTDQPQMVQELAPEAERAFQEERARMNDYFGPVSAARRAGGNLEEIAEMHGIRDPRNIFSLEESATALGTPAVNAVQGGRLPEEVADAFGIRHPENILRLKTHAAR